MKCHVLTGAQLETDVAGGSHAEGNNRRMCDEERRALVYACALVVSSILADDRIGIVGVCSACACGFDGPYTWPSPTNV